MARHTKEDKRRLATESLSQLLELSAASEKAEAIMEKYNNWLSSENDRKVFFEALVNPPAPNAKLKEAMQKHDDT